MASTEKNPTKHSHSTTPATRVECRLTKLAETYTGTVHHTALGDPCEFWVFVKQIKYNDEDFPDGSMQTTMNFCRNPSKDSKGIWCFTDLNGDYDYCNAPYCDCR